MQVHYDEGVASHICPEPCVSVREGGRSVGTFEGIGGAPTTDEVVFMTPFRYDRF